MCKIRWNMEITDIRWKNIYLTIEFNNVDTNQIYLYDEENKKELVFNVYNQRATINITNVENYGMLMQGNWVVSKKVEECLKVIPISIQLGYRCEYLDKVFPYYKKAYAYIVQIQPIAIGECVGCLGCQISTCFMQKNNKPRRRKVFVEANSMSGYIKRMITNICEVSLRILYKLSCVVVKKDGKHILFMSETRTPISGNLKAIDNRIKERKLDYRIQYCFFKSLQQKEILTYVNWIKLVVILAKMDFVFVDDYAAIFRIIDLDTKTKLTQVWHAGVGFKSVGYARFGKDGSPHPIDSGHRKYDYVVVGGDALIPVYQEAFGINKSKFLPVGLPRLDGYLDEDLVLKTKKKIYKEYPILKDKKIILFAPTYRGKGQKEAYYPYEKVDLAGLFNMCGSEYIFAVKMHPFIRTKIDIPDCFKERIVDLSSYKDINELFYVTDILITDFSSNIYEFSLQEKPIIFYAFDKDFYQIQHGVHRTLDEAPGKVCTTFSDVIKAIKSKDFEIEKTILFKQCYFKKSTLTSCDLVIDTVLGINN